MLKDTTKLIAAQFIAKISGLIRELILLNFFGTSAVFADYLRLLSSIDFISFFYKESGLMSNLLGKFSEFHKKKLSFDKIKQHSLIISTILFFITLIIQVIASKYFNITDYNFWLIILINSLSSFLIFYFNIGQIIIVASSNLKEYNESIIIYSLSYATLLYPLIYLLNISGAAVNRIIAITLQYPKNWHYVNHKFSDYKQSSNGLSLSDFNIWIFLTNNSLYLWFIIIRFTSVLDVSPEIIYITYAFTFASALDGVFLKPLSIYFLERFVNSNQELSEKMRYASLIIAILSALLLTLDISSLDSTFNLISRYSDYIKYFVPFISLTLSNGTLVILNQKVFASSDKKNSFNQAKIYILISISLILVLFILCQVMGILIFKCVYILIVAQTLTNIFFTQTIFKFYGTRHP